MSSSSSQPFLDHQPPAFGTHPFIADSYDPYATHHPEWTEHTVPQAEGSEALARATKDLISLDERSPTWATSIARAQASHNLPQKYSRSDWPTATHLYNTNFPQPPPRSSTKASSLSSSRPASQTPAYAFLPPTPLAPSNTKPFDDTSSYPHKRSSPLEIPTDPSAVLKRPKTSPPPNNRILSAQSSPSSSTAPSNSAGASLLIPKPPLLTASQKKANHIQSEQKRRANIKRGYEALCETIPALREAIRVEEEQHAANLAAGIPPGKKRPRQGKDSPSEATNSEKIDGRAGPRSENIVLQKTIDHLRAMLDERHHLVERLARARSALVPGHPLLRPPSSGELPLWEREWHGGQKDHEDDQDSEEE